MGVGAIRAIQTMTSKMIITRNMGGGAAIQRHDDEPSIMSELGAVTVPRSRLLCEAQICHPLTGKLAHLSI